MGYRFVATQIPHLSDALSIRVFEHFSVLDIGVAAAWTAANYPVCGNRDHMDSDLVQSAAALDEVLRVDQDRRRLV